jgi:hypothetical protein
MSDNICINGALKSANLHSLRSTCIWFSVAAYVWWRSNTIQLQRSLKTSPRVDVWQLAYLLTPEYSSDQWRCDSECQNCHQKHTHPLIMEEIEYENGGNRGEQTWKITGRAVWEHGLAVPGASDLMAAILSGSTIPLIGWHLYSICWQLGTLVRPLGRYSTGESFRIFATLLDIWCSIF